jgi:hypothetical protein
MISTCINTPADPAFTRRINLVLGGIVVLALALRLPNLDGSLWIDEAGSLAQASARDFWATARQDVHPPLYYLVLRAAIGCTDSIPILRLFSVACGTGLALAACLALRRSLPGAIVAGTIAAALPELVSHSQQLRPYALLYLLLGIALVFAGLAASGHGGPLARGALGLALLAAAATHLITGFFLLALAPVLWWPASARPGVDRWTGLWPLLPAGLLMLWFKFAFVLRPASMAEGWWLSVPDLRGMLTALGEAGGWNNIQWLDEAVERRFAVAGWGVPLVAGAALGVAFAAAWGHRAARPLKLLLPLAAAIYTAALVGYSRVFEPVFMTRTLLPGLILLGAGLAWGIGHQPRPWLRWAATGCIGLYLVMAILPTLRMAAAPAAGLRGLAATMRTAQQSGDAIILFRAMDIGLAPYWPGLPDHRPIQLDQTRPFAPQLADLRARLDGLPDHSRVWLAYRDDYYFRRDATAFDGVCREITTRDRALRIAWQENDLTLLVAEPKLK